jgi:hypothetical protein
MGGDKRDMHNFELIEDYSGMGKSLKISNGKLELVATLEVGPRIIRFAVPGKDNVFGENVPVCEKVLDDTWKIYGGHRVWHSPEEYPRSYMPDNKPLEKYEISDKGVTLYQNSEPWVQIKKSIEVILEDDKVVVKNRLKNEGAWPMKLAVWSLSIGARGGLHIAPMVQRNTGLLPNRHIVMWPDSVMNDKRVYWGRKYIILKNDDITPGVLKYGYPNEYGWAAYFVNNYCFIKKYKHEIGKEYPDNGCSWEAYTADWGIELESISPLEELMPGQTLCHENEWYLFDNIQKPEPNDDSIENTMKTLAAKAGISLPEIDQRDWKEVMNII